MVRARPLRHSLVAFFADGCDRDRSCMPGEPDGALAHSPSSTLHEHRAPIHGSSYVYGVMSGDAWDTQARPLFERDTIREVNRLFSRYHHVFRGRAERTIALRAEAPHALANARRRHLI